ncbi:MAG TPA: TrpB-like pyridoxal phosphate-dependent enzyme [Nitrososphaerales archaeon]|nr:TrpB-like pyridoxal phosphate-dependent enzyme [Nitrososphaerales archaeon]
MVTETQQQTEIPTQWYSVVPDLPSKLPPVIDPATRQVAQKSLLHRLFIDEMARHEYSGERFIPIPEELRRVYSIWRPTRLVRAYRLEKALNTPARIYYKNESVSPSGSHKANAAVAQAYFAAKQGVERLVTSTTAGQWGTALAFGCSLFGVKCTIFMSRSSYNEKPYRKDLAEAWGAEILPSPSDKTSTGRKLLAENPDGPGTMSIAKSEALEYASSLPNARNAVGSIMNFVLASQTVVGEEAREQLAAVDDYPDVMVGCVGGGSNFSGLFWPFYHDIANKKNAKPIRFIGAESTGAPRLTKGEYIYDHADIMRTSPLFKMYTIGHTFVPPTVQAGGLRVHGSAPTLSLLAHEGAIEPRAYNQLEVFEAANYFAQHEGILPAPETAHAIKAVIDEAKACKEAGRSETIVFNLCGHGMLDIEAYREYRSGKMQRGDADPAAIRKALDQVKSLYPWLNQ